MKQYLQVYRLQIETLAPIFIGSGACLNKHEYIFDKHTKKVYMPNEQKLYSFMVQHQKQNEFACYLQKPKIGFAQWLQQQNISKQQWQTWTAYEIDAGDRICENQNTTQLRTFMKDAYQKPYVPGSSVKGALRTVLMQWYIEQQPQNFQKLKQDIQQFPKNNTKTFANFVNGKNEILEKSSFVRYEKIKRYDKIETVAKNCLSGLRVSDSLPLHTDDLVLCQKIDVLPDGTQNKLPIVLECLKPGTKITMDITIDTKLFPNGMEQLQKSIQSFGQRYHTQFRKFFSNTAPLPEQIIYIGGGSGYVTKTATYTLLGNSAVPVVSALLHEKAKKHKHQLDAHRYHISPHMLKQTTYDGRLYEFGMCRCTFAPK